MKPICCTHLLREFSMKMLSLVRLRQRKKERKEKKRQTDSQAGRQTDRQTGRQAGRQAGRQTDRDRVRKVMLHLKKREKKSCSISLVCNAFTKLLIILFRLVSRHREHKLTKLHVRLH